MLRKVIAADIGGTNIRVALVRRKKIFKLLIKKTPRSKQAFLKELVSMISDVMVKRVSGIGVGIAGPLKNGIIENPPNLPLKNFNLKRFLEKKFEKRVEVYNDVNCVALAEMKYGIRKRNFIVLTLGTGIGGGIVIDKRIYTGNGRGGELGHIILHDGKDFEFWWKKYGKGKLMKNLIKSRSRKDKERLRFLAMYIGQGIASLISVFDPEAVVLAGAARESGGRFLSMIKKEVARYKFLLGKTDIMWSKLEHPGILGASLLI